MLAPGTILNIASGHARRIGDLLSDLAALAGVELTIRVDKARVRDMDVRMACGVASRVRELLAWTASIAWARTLQDVIDDWRERISADPS